MFRARAAAWVERLSPARRKGFGPEGRIIAPTFDGLGAVFYDDGKIRPYSVLIYPTTSCMLPALLF